MNCKTSLFAVLFAVPFALINDGADAKYCNSSGSKAPAGKYCKALTQFDCEPGCYCTGGGNFTWGVGDVPKGCKNRWNKVTSELNSKGVYLCPSDYPESASGATNKSQCFTKSNNGSNVYYGKTVKCEAGKYLPAGETSCAACQSDSVCYGGTFDFSKSSAKGLSKCSGGQVPNAKRTACETSKTSCASGKYLPANSTSCTSCKSRYYLCIGGTFAKSSSDQGITKCPSGQISDYNRKQCVNEAVPTPAPAPTPAPEPTPTQKAAPTPDPTYTCQEKEYLPAGSPSCAPCSATELCLGGTFTKQPSAQGKTTCGDNQYADYTKKQCVTKAPETTFCGTGQYLRANEKSCVQCKIGHICPGGTYPIAPYDQGATACPNGMGPNETKTECIYGSYTCYPGFYLPAQSGNCVKCPDNKSYCPGGTFTATTYDQGKKACPDKTKSNATKTACVITLNQQQMKYGINEKTDATTDAQCWTRTSMSDYVYCMFGGKIKIPYKEEKPAPSTDAQTIVDNLVNGSATTTDGTTTTTDTTTGAQ